MAASFDFRSAYAHGYARIASCTVPTSIADPDTNVATVIEQVRALRPRLREVWLAAEHESAERTAEEISQLLYRVQVIMLGKGLTPADVYRHL